MLSAESPSIRIDTKDIVPIMSPELSILSFSENEYLLHQKKYGHYLKVSKSVYSLLNLIDGKKSLEQISREYSSIYKEKITPELSYNLLFKKLSKYGLLTNTAHLAEYVKKPDYLKLSFTIIGKETLSKITPLFNAVFNPKYIRSVLLISTLICLITLWLNFQEIKDFFYMFTPTSEAVLTFFGILFLSVTFHEIGHVSAARFYGAEHGGIGGGFYLFTPVYYADVTDIWRLLRKHRIIVNLAGVYFELIFCGILCMLSLLISSSYLGVMAFMVFIHSLYNLVPFIRNDGYWVLSDALNIPNLAKNSGNLFIGWLKDIRLLRKYKYSPKIVFLLIYGCINTSFIVFYVCSVLLYDANSVLYFPVNLYNYLGETLWTTDSGFTFSDLKEFVIPAVFNLLLFRFLKRLVKNNVTKLKRRASGFET